METRIHKRGARRRERRGESCSPRSTNGGADTRGIRFSKFYLFFWPVVKIVDPSHPEGSFMRTVEWSWRSSVRRGIAIASARRRFAPGDTFLSVIAYSPANPVFRWWRPADTSLLTMASANPSVACAPEEAGGEEIRSFGKGAAW